MNELEIANSALIKLGEKPILALTADTTSARLLSVRMKPVIDIVLRLHPWNCCTRRSILTPTTTTPLFGFTYTHVLPSDFLRLVSTDVDDEYRLEKDALYADSNRIELIYIARPTDISTLDPLCAEAIAAYLAWDLCYAITQSGERVSACFAGFKNALRAAKFVNATENPAGQITMDELIEEHHG